MLNAKMKESKVVEMSESDMNGILKLKMSDEDKLFTQDFSCAVEVKFTVRTRKEDSQFFLVHSIVCNGQEHYIEAKQLPDDLVFRQIALLRLLPENAQLIEQRIADAALDIACQLTEDIAKQVVPKDGLDSVQRSSFVSIYKHLHKALKEAKALYRRNKKQRKWQQLVRAAYPFLSDELIEKLADNSGRGKYDDAPSRLALKYTAKCFGLNLSSKQAERILKRAMDEFPHVGTAKNEIAEKLICDFLKDKLMSQN